jgi:hypothetical protein
MKKDWKYLIYLSIVFGLFVIVKLTSPKQYDWHLTLSHDDRNPYGTYVLNELLPSVLTKRITKSYLTLYELKDSLKENANVFIVSSRFNAGREDVTTLLDQVYDGGTAFISAQYFSGLLADTLRIETNDHLFEDAKLVDKTDSAFLKITNPFLDTTARYWYRQNDIHQYFNKFDTARATVVARNGFGEPVTLKFHWGDGFLLINATPMAFTNIYVLTQNNYAFVSDMLSYLPDRNVQWTEYYHLGRMESMSPLRFILSNDALRWAYYLTIFSIVIFILFEAKRKQRIIPIVKPLPNTTLQFVSTIGNLYFQHGDHKNIAEKKINFLLDYIRTRYFLPTNTLDDNFTKLLAHKSGKSEDDVKALFNTVNYINRSSVVNVDILLDLNDKMERFTT